MKDSNVSISKASEAPKAAKEESKAPKAFPRTRRQELRIESPRSPELDALVYELIGLGMHVHSALGPGLREQVYEDAYIIALEEKGIDYVRQVPFQVTDLGRSIRPIRLDLVVDGKVIVELKAVTQLHDIHSSQMLTYLKLTELPVGILINFNTRHLRDGIRRFVRRP